MKFTNIKNINFKNFYNKYLKYQLKVIFTPSCWSQSGVYSKPWDTKLNELLSEFKTNYYKINNAHIFLKDNDNKEYSIWIANHPYGSFSYEKYGITFHPKRKTILNAMDILQNKIFNIDI